MPPPDETPGVPAAPDPGAPADAGPAPAPEPPVPWPGPLAPDVPMGGGTTNETPVLPHNAQGGAAKAAAVFERVYTIASDAQGGSAGDMTSALARIQGIAEAAVGDVGRFAPAQLRQVAADAADDLVSGTDAGT